MSGQRSQDYINVTYDTIFNSLILIIFCVIDYDKFNH